MIVPSPSPSPDARAEDIFARTRVALAARTFPAEMKFAVRITGVREGVAHVRTYRAFERWPEGSVNAHALSDEERANPARPTGINILIPFVPHARAPEPDIIGVPELAPTYAFGLMPRAGPDDPTPPPDASGGQPRTIGTVVAFARTYDVRLAGEEPIATVPCYHLTLRPLGNRGRYRLRDLWVDERSYDLVRLRTEGNFTRKSTGAGFWTVDFVRRDGRSYLATETSEGPVDGEDGTYDRITVEFVDVEADPRENLDFGISGGSGVIPLVEP